MVKFKDFSRPLSVFQVLFKANLVFKDFSDSPVYTSTFQACANPEFAIHSMECRIAKVADQTASKPIS